MTKTEFLILCNEYSIAPEIALEDAEVRAALYSHNDELVKELLINNF